MRFLNCNEEIAAERTVTWEPMNLAPPVSKMRFEFTVTLQSSEAQNTNCQRISNSHGRKEKHCVICAKSVPW
jgi:hypothetical protein